MNECARALEDLALLLADEIEPERRAALLRHLDACPACAAERNRLEQAFADLRDEEVPDPGPVYWSGFESRVRARLATPRRSGLGVRFLAAAAALVAVAGAGLFLERRGGPAREAAPVALGTGTAGELAIAEARFEAALDHARDREIGDEDFDAILDEVAPGDPFEFTGMLDIEPDRDAGV